MSWQIVCENCGWKNCGTKTTCHICKQALRPITPRTIKCNQCRKPNAVYAHGDLCSECQERAAIALDGAALGGRGWGFAGWKATSDGSGGKVRR